MSNELKPIPQHLIDDANALIKDALDRLANEYDIGPKTLRAIKSRMNTVTSIVLSLAVNKEPKSE